MCVPSLDRALLNKGEVQGANIHKMYETGRTCNAWVGKEGLCLFTK